MRAGGRPRRSPGRSRRTTRRERPAWIAAALVAVLLALATGCAPSLSGPDATVRSNLTQQVLATLDRWGVPAKDDYVDCSPARAGKVSCTGETAYSPQDEITAGFPLHRRPGGGCPGRLTVKVASATLATPSVDPCR